MLQLVKLATEILKDQPCLPNLMRELEEHLLLEALETRGWSIAETARDLGYTRTGLHERLKKASFHRPPPLRAQTVMKQIARKGWVDSRCHLHNNRMMRNWKQSLRKVDDNEAVAFVSPARNRVMDPNTYLYLKKKGEDMNDCIAITKKQWDDYEKEENQKALESSGYNQKRAQESLAVEPEQT